MMKRVCFIASRYVFALLILSAASCVVYNAIASADICDVHFADGSAQSADVCTLVFAASVVTPTVCEVKMEAAMRAKEETDAHDERLRQSTSTYIVVGDATNTITCCTSYDTYGYTYVPDKRTDEQRLDDEEKAIQKSRVELAERRKREKAREVLQAENKAMRARFTKLWAEAKHDCWRKP